MADRRPMTTDEIAATTTLDAHERSELKNPGYEIFIAALSLLSILNLLLLIFVQDENLTYVILVINAVVSLVLFLDFLYRLLSAESRTTYFFRRFGWADLLASLPLAQLKVLRIFRLIRVYRLLREYGARNVGRSLLVDRAGSALYTLLFVAILVLEFGSLEMLNIERTAPGANITSASDAIWYTIVTISTVGYGDQYPVTNPGRVMGSIIIVIGVAIFGTLTGFLANSFLGRSGSDDDESQGAGPDVAPDTDPVDRQLARLAELARIKESGVLTEDELAATKERILSQQS